MPQIEVSMKYAATLEMAWRARDENIGRASGAVGSRWSVVDVDYCEKLTVRGGQLQEQ